MNQRLCRRLLSIALMIALVVSLFSGLTVFAATGTPSANSGVRDTVCTSLSSQAQSYYTGSNTYASLSKLSGVDSTDSYTATQGNPLYTALYNLMSSTRNDTQVVYSGTGTSSLAYYWGYTDAEAASSTYLYFYTDILANDPSVSSLVMNREHVWPQSKASYYQLNGGADLHHLRPSISGVNQSKSNNAFANLIGTGTTYSAYQVNNVDVIWTGTKDFDNVLEVRDNIKGDVARILLYVYCRWQQPNLYSDVASANLPALDSDDSSNSGERIIEDRATLLRWCQQDPVDEWEMQRNDQIENIQGNRNVFIDYPEFAWLMFGLTPPSDMQTPSGEAAGGASTVTITANSNNTAWGTVSVSGSTITASPAEGYYASGYEVTSGSATVTQDGNQFSVSASSDCTVKIIFTAKTAVTVNFSVPNGVTQAAIKGYADEAITLPTPSGTPSATAQNYSFVGWVTASLDDTTTQPTILKSGDSYTTSTDTTLYALYTYTTGGNGTTEYRLVTSAEQLVAGSSVVIAAASYDYALSTTQNGNNRGQAVIVKNTTDNTVAFAADAGVAELKLGVGTTDGTWSFYDGSNSGYLYAASSSSNYLRTEPALSDNSSYAVTVSSDGTVTLAAQGTNTRNYVRYNSSNKIFSCYASTSTTVQPIALYIATAAGTVYYTTVLESACDHVYTDVVTPATCTADGYTTHTCSLCGYVYVDSTIPATGHSYDEGVITTPATCEEAGVKTFTCANCGDTYTEAIPSVGHNYVDGVCTNCGAAQGASNTYRLITTERGLTSGNYVLIVKAGGKNPGSYSYYALKQQEDSGYLLAEAADTYVGTSDAMPSTISVSDDAIVWDTSYDTTMSLSDGSSNVLYTTTSNSIYCRSGTASAWTLTFNSSTSTFTFKTTDNGGKTRYLGLRDDLTSIGSNGNPRFRCNSAASTTSYQFYLYLQETASHTHSGTAVAAKAATCTEAGNKAYWTCTCGKLFADAACTTETTPEAVTIAATGHTVVTDAAVAPTCTTTGLTEGSHCSVCNEVLVAQEVVAATGHTVVTDAAVAPTCTETGLTEGSHCSVCDAVIVAQEVVAALSHNYVYADNSNGTHTATCSVCGNVVTENCAYSTSVSGATTTYTCSLCGYSYSETKEFYDIYYETPNSLGYVEHVIEGESVTLPEAEAIDGYTFSGWVTAAIAEETATAPTILTGSYTPTASVTLYAVYTRIGSGEWKLVTNDSTLSAGTQLLIASNQMGFVAGDISSTFMLREVAADFASAYSTVTKPDDAIVLTLGGSEGAWTLANADGQLLGATAVGKLAWSSGTTTWSISISNNDATIQNGTSSYGKFMYSFDSGFVITTSDFPGMLFLPQLYSSSVETYYTTNPTPIVECTHSSVYYQPFCDSTCTTEGNIEYWYCPDCGKHFSDAGCTTETTLEAVTIAATGHAPVTDAAVAPTCTETGLTEGSHCSVCGETIVAQETVAALGHSYTYVDNGDGTHTATCSVCNDTVTADHTFVDGTCVCGAYEGSAEPTLDSSLKFTATSFTMGAELKFVFIMTKATATKYPTEYVDIVVNGADGDKTVRFNLEDMVLYNNTIYRVEFTGIGAKMMGDTFTATIHAEDENGNAFIGEPKSTTIANELLTVIRKSNATSTIKTLGVDMLNYGAAAQAYFDYNADNPVNAALTEEEKAYGTQETPTVTNTMSKTSTGAVTIVSPAVTLGSKVTLNMIFNTTNYTGDKGKLTYKITDVTTNTVVATGPMVQTSGNFYKCVYDDVGAARMRKNVTIGVYDENDELVSQVQTWSVESYIANTLSASNSTQEIKTLLEAMIKYGDSAAAYLG